MLITIVMIMGGVVAVVFTAQPIPEKVPMAYLGISTSGQGVELTNKVGDTLTSSSVTIVVDGIDRTAEFRSQENTPGWGTLKAGERIHYTSPTRPESVQIVYAGNSGQYLLASSGTTISSPIKIVPTPSIPVQPLQAAAEQTNADAAIISATIPSNMSAGLSYPVSVTMKNTGTLVWDAGSSISLAGVGDRSGVAAKFGPYRVSIPAGTIVRGGETYTFNFPMTAPGVPGDYSPQYTMTHGDNRSFGTLVSRTIQVQSLATVDAVLVSSTIPTTMTPGQSYNVSVTMKNTGSIPWNKGSMISLGGVGADDELDRSAQVENAPAPAVRFGPGRICIPEGTSVATGAQHTFNFTMTAPPAQGTFTTHYKMVWDGHQWFGALASRTITVVNPESLPHAQFTSDVTQGSSPLFVQFTDQSTGAAPMTCHWDFSDGEGNLPENSQKAPVWRFWEEYGTSYTVTLTVTNAYGSDTIVKQNYIMLSTGPSATPAAAFTSSVQSGTVPLTVRFSDQSTGTPLTYAWDFNNDKIIESTVKSPTFTYTTAGNYTVNLTVTYADGKDTEIKTSYIRVLTAGTTPTPTPTPTQTITPAKLPAAQFTANTTQGKNPLAVQFTDLSASTGTTTYAWDINNDGITDYTIKNPVHTYQAAGTYTVKLSVTNASGSDSETKTAYITSTSSPVPGTGDCYGAVACNPTGNPIGGGAGYTRIIPETDARVKYVVSTKDQLLTALKNAKSGEVVFVKGSAVIDMTGTPNNIIPAGVTLASDRGNGASQGALIKYSYNSNGRYLTSLFEAGGNNVRITGIRLEGEMLPQDGTGNGEASYLIAIKVQDKAGLEVDNCEIRGWAWSCVTTMDSTGTNIHHNYMHHNQARGEGYGADIYGGDMLVEANIFNYNRHDIAGGGYPGERYEARYNLVHGDGHPIGSHHFDVHACNPNDYSDDSETSTAFIAGDLYKIHHNTFEAGDQAPIGIRSRPVTGAYINNNIFMSDSTDTSGGKPVWQRAVTWGNMFVTNNYWKGTLYNGDQIVWYLHP